MWLQELGVKVNLALQEWKVYLNSLSLDYGIARSSLVGDHPDPNTFLDHVRHRQREQSDWVGATRPTTG